MRYHVLMVDPDAPSKEMQTYKYYFHWGLMNIMVRGMTIEHYKLLV